MSDELHNQIKILMDPRELPSLRDDDGRDSVFEPEPPGSYAARFAELLSIFLPDEESATAHHPSCL